MIIKLGYLLPTREDTNVCFNKTSIYPPHTEAHLEAGSGPASINGCQGTICFNVKYVKQEFPYVTNLQTHISRIT